jgi:hypothetical protein
VQTASVEVGPLPAAGRIGTTAVRTMPDARVPRYVARDAQSRARLAWWAGDVGGVPSAVVELRPGRDGVAGMALRWRGGGGFRFQGPTVPERPGLQNQPGEPFRPGACWSVHEQDGAVAVRRDGALVAVLRGRLGAARPAGLRAARCTTDRHAVAAAVLRQVRGTARLVVPLEPVPAQDPRQDAVVAGPVAREAHDAGWRALAARAVQIRLPERRVQDAVQASLVHLLVPRYRLADGTWVQAVNKLQYHAFWLRDMAVIARALDHAGLGTEAEQDLAFAAAWQNPDGQFNSRPGQLDGHGQALWALGEHVRLTGDEAFARAWAPRVAAAVRWLDAASAADPLGLVPPSDPRDNELVVGHLTGDSAWAIAGLGPAAELLRRGGDPAGADAALALRERLRSRFAAAARQAAGGGGVPPALDAPGGQDWGNLWLAWPEPVLDPDDPLVTATLRRARRRFAEGIATYADGRSLHGYLGFRVWQTELRRGEQRAAVDGLYATLAHLTATHGGFETGVRPYGRRTSPVNLAPHGWLAAELVSFVRDLLVHETPDGLTFLGALPPAWAQPGARTAIEDAPTAVGPATVRLQARRGGARLSWRVTLRPGAGEPVLRAGLPAGARDVRVVAGPATLEGRGLRLGASAGTVELRWRAPRVDRSLERTVEALRAAFRRRGVPAP